MEIFVGCVWGPGWSETLILGICEVQRCGIAGRRGDRPTHLGPSRVRHKSLLSQSPKKFWGVLVIKCSLAKGFSESKSSERSSLSWAAVGVTSEASPPLAEAQLVLLKYNAKQEQFKKTQAAPWRSSVFYLLFWLAGVGVRADSGPQRGTCFKFTLKSVACEWRARHDAVWSGVLTSGCDLQLHALPRSVRAMNCSLYRGSLRNSAVKSVLVVVWGG